MNVMVIMHDSSEGPGTLEEYLLFKKIGVQTVRLYAHDLLPQTADDYDAVVTMVGPMNVYEDEKYPFLRKESIFLNEQLNAVCPSLAFVLVLK
jgi:GMP synthase-like glutamine amidotransferase